MFVWFVKGRGGGLMFGYRLGIFIIVLGISIVFDLYMDSVQMLFEVLVMIV